MYLIIYFLVSVFSIAHYRGSQIEADLPIERECECHVDRIDQRWAERYTAFHARGVCLFLFIPAIVSLVLRIGRHSVLGFKSVLSEAFAEVLEVSGFDF